MELDYYHINRKSQAQNITEMENALTEAEFVQFTDRLVLHKLAGSACRINTKFSHYQKRWEVRTKKGHVQAALAALSLLIVDR